MVRPRRKYRNVPTVVDGISFDSKKEAARYGELRILMRAKEITDLKIHPRYPLSLNGIPITTYEADFSYFCRVRNRQIVEDVKSPFTEKLNTFQIKRRLMKAIHNIDVEIWK